jgi:hypothetical protein
VGKGKRNSKRGKKKLTYTEKLLVFLNVKQRRTGILNEKKSDKSNKNRNKKTRAQRGGSSIFFLTQKIVSSNFTCGVSVSN